MRKYSPAVLFMAAILSFFQPAQAGTDELEGMMRESLERAKAASTGEKDACGYIFDVIGEYVRTAPGEKAENHKINWQPAGSGGCNEAPNTMQITRDSKNEQTRFEDGAEYQYTVMSHVRYNLDPAPSTEIAGKVVDKNSKPVKDAEVKAEDIYRSRPPVTTRTDAEGSYSLKVSSGQYRVTAKQKSCRALQTLWACTYGKTLEAKIHQKRFPLDLVTDCSGDMDLNIKGTYEPRAEMKMEGLSGVWSAGASGVSGKVSLAIDSETGKVSGEGTLSHEPVKLKGQLHGADVALHGDGAFGNSEWDIRVDGLLDRTRGVVSLKLDCASTSQISVDAIITGNGGGGSRSTVEPGSGCAGTDWAISFSLPWKEGERHHVDRKLAHTYEGLRVSRHEILDLTLGTPKEETGKEEGKKDGKPAPPGKGGDGASAGGGKKRGSGGGGKPPPFTLPGGMKLEGMEGMDEAEGAEVMKQLQDMMQQHSGQAEPDSDGVPLPEDEEGE